MIYADRISNEELINGFKEKKKFNNKATKLTNMIPKISWYEKYSKSFLFFFRKKKPSRVNKKVAKKEYI
jgi:hypothetical protein